jgi:hypothetical protein
MTDEVQTSVCAALLTKSGPGSSGPMAADVSALFFGCRQDVALTLSRKG